MKYKVQCKEKKPSETSQIFPWRPRPDAPFMNVSAQSKEEWEYLLNCIITKEKIEPIFRQELERLEQQDLAKIAHVIQKYVEPMVATPAQQGNMLKRQGDVLETIPIHPNKTVQQQYAALEAISTTMSAKLFDKVPPLSLKQNQEPKEVS